jgi:Tol biopolymer transport system component
MVGKYSSVRASSFSVQRCRLVFSLFAISFMSVDCAKQLPATMRAPAEQPLSRFTIERWTNAPLSISDADAERVVAFFKLPKEAIKSIPDLARVARDSKSSISRDGRWIAFRSIDRILPSDTNGMVDVFLVDRDTKLTELISVGINRRPADGMSEHHEVSADGRFVAFSSYATNLVAGDSNGMSDIFVRDRTLGTTVRLLGSGGAQPNGNSLYPPISEDGRYVALSSEATNFVSGDRNDVADVFLVDSQTNEIILVSLAMNGQEANGRSTYPSLSGDGRYVVFTSAASNLVPGDTNGKDDVFVFDRTTRSVARVSLSASGAQLDDESYNYNNAVSDGNRRIAFATKASNTGVADQNGAFDIFVRDVDRALTVPVSLSRKGVTASGNSLHPTISADGRYVAFHSSATDLVTNDSNKVDDVFVFDLLQRRVSLVSTRPGGQQGNGPSFRTSISRNGRVIAFSSEATNLIDGDTNNVTDLFSVTR